MLMGTVLFGSSGCVPRSIAAPPPSGAMPTFDPVAFFQGQTHGTGTLHILFHRAQTTDVRGIGVMAAGGGITLDQQVTREDGVPKRRTWRLRPIGAGRYTGTLTDAVGPVYAETRGSALRITFAMKGGLKVEQALHLRPGGQVALNTMTVRKLGIVVARLEERIERL